MYLELHLLQNFAPSNLNRDDTGAPKECLFGGVSRARISSQCLKRSIRQSDEFRRVVAGHQAVRTRRLIVEIAERLSGQRPAPESVTRTIADVFKEAGLERPEQRGTSANGQGGEEAASTETSVEVVPEEKDNTKLLLFMDARSIDEGVEVFHARWQALTRGDKEQRTAAITELGTILVASARVPDVALYGRMIEMDTKKPFGKLNLGVDPATQVAHALSTHEVPVGEDFYTAVDDLLPRGETGAGMMGSIFYNSACYYRYANVNLKQLADNLGSNRELAVRTAEAFLRAAIIAIPTGKQTSMAAQNPPSLVMAVVRDAGLWSLANAFERPVRPTEDRGLIDNSIRALDRQWGKLATMFGTDGIRGVWLVESEDVPLRYLGANRVASVRELVQHVLDALRAGVAA
jgi:CRISPR system Cascade subunit CasC